MRLTFWVSLVVIVFCICIIQKAYEQSGYLTIKNAIEDSYVLGFPNREVKKALFELVLPIMLKKN